MQTAREQSQALNEKLRKLKGIDEQISQQQNQLTAEQTRLESEQDTLVKQIAGLDKQISAAETDDLATVQAELAELEAKSEEREEKQAAVAALGEEDATVRQENVSLYEDMTEIRERLDDLRTVDGAECPLCGQDLTEAHRAALLEELEADGKQKGDTYRANQQRMKDIEAEKKTLTTDIKTLTDELAALPRLQKREGELAAQKQAAEDATRQRETAQKRLDEVQRQLAEDDFAPEIRGELNALREQKQALGYDEDAHDEQDEALKTYQRFEDLRNQLNVAENSLETVQQAYDANQARKERLTKAIADLDEDIAALDKDIEKLAALEETFREREKDRGAASHQGKPGERARHHRGAGTTGIRRQARAKEEIRGTAGGLRGAARHLRRATNRLRQERRPGHDYRNRHPGARSHHQRPAHAHDGRAYGRDV